MAYPLLKDTAGRGFKTSLYRSAFPSLREIFVYIFFTYQTRPSRHWDSSRVLRSPKLPLFSTRKGCILKTKWLPKSQKKKKKELSRTRVVAM